MSTSFLRDLSPDEKKQALLRISQFVLREPTREVRESIFKRLLEIGIYLSEKTILDDILDIIKKQFFGIELDKTISEKYLKQLLDEGIIKEENGKYFLDELKRSEIEDYSKKTLSLVTSIEVKFIEAVSQRYGEVPSKEDTNTITGSFYKFILILVSRYIVNAARLLVKGTLTRISISTGKNIVNSATSNMTNRKLRESVKTILIDWMQSPEDEFIRYLFNMRQNFFCIEVLNLDPECRILEREAFSKKRLFLDTNVLMSLILHAIRKHVQVKKLINNTLKLGCSIYVTKRTMDEFNSVLDKAKGLFVNIRATPHQLTRVSNVFIQTYGMSQISQRPISWKEYIYEFLDMEKFLESIGVQIYHKEQEEIKELTGYPGLVDEVQRCFMRHRAAIKTYEVAEHDAYHILLVKTLRESETIAFLGPDTWFLTLDLTLSCTDRFVRRNFDFTKPTSSIMIGYLWDEIISPFLIGIIEERDLIEVFKTFIISEFTPIAEEIDAEILAKSEIDWSDYDWLEPEEIIEVTNQEFFINYLSRREEISKISERESIDEIRRDFNINFSRMIGRISNRKIEQIKTQLEIKEVETEELKKTSARMTQQINEIQAETRGLKEIVYRYNFILDKTKYIISAFSWIVIFLIFYKFILLPTMEAKTAGLYSMIIATVFGYLIGFPGYKWLLEKLLSWKK